jgi:hypothetical protein
MKIANGSGFGKGVATSGVEVNDDDYENKADDARIQRRASAAEGRRRIGDA